MSLSYMQVKTKKSSKKIRDKGATLLVNVVQQKSLYVLYKHLKRVSWELGTGTPNILQSVGKKMAGIGYTSVLNRLCSGGIHQRWGLVGFLKYSFILYQISKPATIRIMMVERIYVASWSHKLVSSCKFKGRLKNNLYTLHNKYKMNYIKHLVSPKQVSLVLLCIS